MRELSKIEYALATELIDELFATAGKFAQERIPKDQPVLPIFWFAARHVASHYAFLDGWNQREAQLQAQAREGTT